MNLNQGHPAYLCTELWERRGAEREERERDGRKGGKKQRGRERKTSITATAFKRQTTFTREHAV